MFDEIGTFKQRVHQQNRFLTQDAEMIEVRSCNISPVSVNKTEIEKLGAIGMAWLVWVGETARAVHAEI